MERPQALKHLVDYETRVHVATLRTVAENAVAELIKASQLDPARSEAYVEWATCTLLADFYLWRANEIATDNKFDATLLARALEKYVEKLAENAPS